jgi:hypothetical protein
MSMITGRIRLSGSKGDKNVDALYDSGASVSFLKKSIAESVEMITPLPIVYTAKTAKNGETIEISEAVRVDFYVGNIRLSDEFFITEDLTEDAIIGAATMQKWRLKLDFENDKVLIDPQVTVMRI